MYTLTGVKRIYHKGGQTVTALAGVDAVIADREWLAIQGPTGHGKTTLLQLLGGLDRPTSGTILFDGKNLGEMTDAEITQVRASSIGFIFQTFNLIPTLPAAVNVELALAPLRLAAAERHIRVAEALDAVGLTDRAWHLPAELSGGQQQRVAIARALVKEPTVLLADEPTGNLDETTRDEIIGLVAKLVHDRGLTLVMVTHDSTLAARAQRIGQMRDGRLVFGGTAFDGTAAAGGAAASGGEEQA
jgi:putative ABC transport system ATP-binding protein